MFFNNWFTSLSLVSVLKEQITDHLGKDLTKRQKGSMKLLYEDNCICVETWNDNDPVTSLSSVDAELPHTQVKLWDSGKIYVGEKYVIGLIISIQLMCSEVLHSKFSS